MSEDDKEFLEVLKEYSYGGFSGLFPPEETVKEFVDYIKKLQQENEELKRKLNWIAFGDDSELALRYLRKIGYVDFDDKRKCYINKHNNEPFCLDDEEEKVYYLKDEELTEYTKQLEQENENSKNILSEFEKWLEEKMNEARQDCLNNISKDTPEKFIDYNLALARKGNLKIYLNKLQEIREKING